MEITDSAIKSTLKEKFGFDDFRYGQLEIIRAVIDGNNSLVVMPTGGGKSLCYQLPAILSEGTAVIISPLIALMKDQVDSLAKLNIPATFINSSLPPEEVRNRLENTSRNLYKLVYIAPERLESNMFFDTLGRAKLSFLAVDEAHCISEWGHDFRPAYLNIVKILERISKLPVIALTATATPEVQEDIVHSLKMKHVKKFIRGFDRPNLSYITEKSENKSERLTEICRNLDGGSAIIYCGSRKRVDMFADSLRQSGIKAQAYHAGMEDKARNSVQESFIGDQLKIIVATNAFGMGIDKPDVRKVIHCDYTQTLESYYQEAGRAGRDGQPAECILLHHPADRNLQEYFINANYPPRSDIKKIYDSIYDMAGARIGEKPIKVLPLNVPDLGNYCNVSITGTNSIITLFEKNNIIRKGLANSSALIKFTTSRERIVEFFNESEGKKKEVLEALLRSVSHEAFSRDVEIDLNHLTEKYFLRMDDVIKYLRQFEFARFLNFIPLGVAGGLIFMMERMPLNNLPIDFTLLEERRQRAEKKLDIVIRYADTGDCKRNFILHYFKETDVKGKCGRCSSCVSGTKPKLMYSKKEKDLSQKILRAAAELDGKFGKTILGYVLAGTKTQKTKSYDIDKMETFGSAKGANPIDLKFRIEKAQSEGLIALSPDVYPTVYITEKGKALLDYDQKPFKFKSLDYDDDVSGKIYMQLKALRDEIASKDGITARAVITDRALRQVSRIIPQNTKDLEGISGVTPYFLSAWGNLFLEKIKTFVQFDEIAEQKKEIPEHLRKIADLINKGRNLEEIQSLMNLAATTLAKDIQDAIEAGLEISLQKLIDPNVIKKVKDILKKKKNATLKDIRARLDIDVDYTILRIAAAVVRKLK